MTAWNNDTHYVNSPVKQIPTEEVGKNFDKAPGTNNTPTTRRDGGMTSCLQESPNESDSTSPFHDSKDTTTQKNLHGEKGSPKISQKTETAKRDLKDAIKKLETPALKRGDPPIQEPSTPCPAQPTSTLQIGHDDDTQSPKLSKSQPPASLEISTQADRTPRQDITI